MPAANGTPAGLRFGEDGLVPVVAQDAATGAVLMVAFMNEAALEATRTTGRAHYWSRGRGRLWRKGETSGHEQVVEQILVNCEQNSLLLQVRQVGAVCHDGYATCYYRRLEPDGTLIVVEDRAFEPADVYDLRTSWEHALAESREAERRLAEASRLAYDAFAALRDKDLADASSTSKRLRTEGGTYVGRVADELRELAGVLDGSHRHSDLATDSLLEGSQIWYWLTIVALRADVPFDRFRPDRALATVDGDVDASLAARLLRADAADWGGLDLASTDVAARCHSTLALVAQACRAANVDPSRIVHVELAELRRRPYLADHFALRDEQPS